ncbi:carbohydrate-binding protein [Aquimarina pacifica]|uniref:carbohydrate-binding protein n=1 Tax=Aquimarina pacifica TaxID=1296415 RepID=UPI0004AE3C75|nr:carbohydrate-binding protein [Aquimarina pacifica]
MKTSDSFFKPLILKNFFLLWLFSLTVNATDLYVSKSGSDTNTGTITSPYLTIQTAINVATAGDIIYVRSGSYAEKIWWANSGSEGSPITLTNYLNEEVTISGITPTNSTQGAQILISSKSYIRINGITFSDNIMNYADGINVQGSGTDIQITNCEFDNIGWTSDKTTFPTPSDSAHAIIFLGSTSTSLNNITISNNYVHDCITGYSESITIVGNVEDFLIENNTLDSNTNIGIDAAGHFTWTGAPTEVNYSRNGIIRNNTVSNYAGPEDLDAAGGIYTDGGSYITIENNTVYNYKVGFSVGCEVAGNTNTGNIVRNNIAYNCSLSGLFLGSNTTSVVQNTEVYGNTFYKCGTGTFDNGQIALQNNDGSSIKNNIMYPTEGRTAMVQMGGTTSTNNTLAYNLYWRDSGDTSNLFYDITNNTNSVMADPLFENASSYDFHISSSSPAIDAGDPSLSVTNDVVDIDGEARIQNGRMDIGVDENGASATIPVTGISLSPENSSLDIGDTLQINASISPTNASNQNVSWTSSNSAIASVNNSGIITANSEGTVTITATTEDGNYTDTTIITVNQDTNITFIPDPNKTYYIDSPIHGLRLAATGESEDAYTTNTNVTGEDVEWKFVDKGNGYWHIDRAAGGTKPRLRSDNTSNADMQPTTSSGGWTYYTISEGASDNTYFLTLPNGPSSYKRLQVQNSGEVKMVPNTYTGTWVSFTITEVSNTTETIHIEAEDYSSMSGIQTENTTDTGGGLNVGWIDAGDWMEYSVDIPITGSYTIDFRVATIRENGNFLFQVDSNTLTSADVNNTGDWQNWTTISSETIELSQGTRTIRIYSTNENWNLNWFEIKNTTDTKSLAPFVDNTDVIKAYPVPVKDVLTISISNYQKYSNLDIVDITGKTLLNNINITSETVSVDLNNFPKGAYFIKLNTIDASSKIIRFIK